MSEAPVDLAKIRPIWRINWLRTIAEFAHFGLQIRSWLGGEEYSSPYWSFTEWMCRYFDALYLSGGYAVFRNDGIVSEEEVQAVRDFHAAADAYNAPAGNNSGHLAILSDPAWQNVVSLADKARVRLLTIVIDPVERSLLERENRQLFCRDTPSPTA